MTGGASKDGVAVGGINQNSRDALGVFQSRVGPVLATVGGFVNAIADGDAIARPALARSYPDGLMVRRIDGYSTDGLDLLPIEDRPERGSPIDRLPHSTA